MIHFNANIPLKTKAVFQEIAGYLSAFFERPRDFTFEAGDWIELSLPEGHLPGGNVYSLASSPHESELRITFRKGASPFKKMLENLAPGDTLVIDKYGNDYGFRLKEHQTSVLIAGGVGVAPFRSMLKEMEEQYSKSSVQLVYLNTADDFLYREEFDEWRHELSGLNVDYIATKELRRKDREKLLSELFSGSKHQYYVSGPSGMVQNTLKLLEKLGADKKSIKIDDFGHY